MALTLTEATAVNRLIDLLCGPSPHRWRHEELSVEDAMAALVTLADGAYKRLAAGATGAEVRARTESPQPRSALGALEVAEALDRHVRHGGSLPWPSVRGPYQRWAKETAARTERQDS